MSYLEQFTDPALMQDSSLVGWDAAAAVRDHIRECVTEAFIAASIRTRKRRLGADETRDQMKADRRLGSQIENFMTNQVALWEVIWGWTQVSDKFRVRPDGPKLPKLDDDWTPQPREVERAAAQRLWIPWREDRIMRLGELERWGATWALKQGRRTFGNKLVYRTNEEKKQLLKFDMSAFEQ